MKNILKILLMLPYAKLVKRTQKRLVYMFNTTSCDMKEKLPLTLYPTRLKLQVQNGTDLSKLKGYQKYKACARLENKSSHEGILLQIFFISSTIYKSSFIMLWLVFILHNTDNTFYDWTTNVVKTVTVVNIICGTTLSKLVMFRLSNGVDTCPSSRW